MEGGKHFHCIIGGTKNIGTPPPDTSSERDVSCCREMDVNHVLPDHADLSRDPDNPEQVLVPRSLIEEMTGTTHQRELWSGVHNYGGDTARNTGQEELWQTWPEVDGRETNMAAQGEQWQTWPGVDNAMVRITSQEGELGPGSSYLPSPLSLSSSSSSWVGHQSGTAIGPSEIRLNFQPEAVGARAHNITPDILPPFSSTTTLAEPSGVQITHPPEITTGSPFPNRKLWLFSEARPRSHVVGQ